MPDDPGQLFEVAAQFRSDLLRRERAASSRLVRAYGQAWQRIKHNLDELQSEIETARAKGEIVDQAWLRERYRLRKLQAQVEMQINQFAQYADASILSEQRAAVAAANEHAEQMVKAATAGRISYTWHRVPTEAVEDLVGFLSNGSPLKALLDELGPSASDGVGAALTTGLALGHNPRKIAGEVAQSVGLGLTRALRISRTEVMRSYREATRRNYLANDDVVRGWIWHAHVSGPGSERTCAACWAMHGSKHKPEERLTDHICGRCAMIADVISWEELGVSGFAGADVQIATGPELFAKLPHTEQNRILGNAAGAAYRDGVVKLEDFVGVRESRLWGPMHYAKSLREVLGAAEAERWARCNLGSGKERIIDGVRITEERRRHWRERHPEITSDIEEGLIRRGLRDPLRITQSKRDTETELRYFQDTDAKWWVLKVARPTGSTPFILTLHRVHKPGK